MNRFTACGVVMVAAAVMLSSEGCKPGDSEPEAKAETPIKPTELNRKGELTRRLAAAILNEHLRTPSISEMKFRDIELALADGVMKNDWKPGDFGGPRYIFTDKGLLLADKCVADAKDVIIGGWGGREVFRLKSAIGETVLEVTGIAVDGSMPTVEFATVYLFSPEMEPFEKYLYSGRRRAVQFRKYDDGWRVHK